MDGKQINDGPIRSYKDLVVWQKSVALAEACYRMSRSFPREEIYGMTSQIRRASVSVPANIAEGHGRESTGAFIQFLRISQGSLKELETHILIAGRVGLGKAEDHGPLLSEIDEIGRMLRSLIRSLQSRQK